MDAITRFFVDRWQFTLVMFALLIALGAGSVRNIAKSEDPITRFPAVGVVVLLPGADAEQIERLIAIPIENALNGLDDVRQITSGSRAGVATIGVEFIYGSDPEKKYDEVVRELNVVRSSLPDGVTLVRADRRNPAQTNVVQMALVSETASFRRWKVMHAICATRSSARPACSTPRSGACPRPKCAWRPISIGSPRTACRSRPLPMR